MSSNDSIRELLEGSTHVAKTGSGEEVISLMQLVQESFGSARAGPVGS